ncbi:hypothetical protein BDV93DRAFT_529481 [Ceratobasidium sp. AG-I]|nr:hypothetical protein BDV93DRAFT_529481 [Ceratobasidium sp. AG-I]
MSINDELPELADEERQLFKSRTTLNILRNRSSTLTPINALPLEILSNIFALTSLSCVRTSAASPNHTSLVCPAVFLSVCTHWRRIAIATSRFWSHIDLVPSSDPSHRLYKRATIWLERAKMAPLHVHIHEKTCARGDGITHLVEFLQPYMQRLCTLYIYTECHSLDLFEAVLDCWLRHGQPGSAKTLILYRPPPIALLASLGPQQLQLLHTRHSRERIEGFLGPLSALRLHNVSMGWGISAHRGLVELHLESLPDRVGLTVGQFADVLRGTPMLRVLKLARMGFRHEGVEEEVESVQLKCLEELNVLAARPSTLKLLLPVIVPGNSPLAMSMALESRNSIFEEVKSFFDRSNVSLLYIDVQNQDWLPLLFGSLRHLQTLAIKGYNLSQTIFPYPELAFNNNSPPVCGQLASLSFIGCILAPELLHNMLAAHSQSLCDVRIWRCKLQSHAGVNPSLTPGETTMESCEPGFKIMRSNHMANYPMLDWSVSDELDGSAVRIPI